MIGFMNKWLALYKRLYSFSAYNVFLYANFLLLFTISFDLEFLYLQIVKLLTAYFITGVAGYFINDFFDIEKDKTSGKFNITNLFHRHLVLLLIIILLVIGFLILKSISEIAFYILFVEIFVLLVYSVKPFRLKEKGFLGIITDSIYAHVLPAIILIVIVNEYVYVSNWLWLCFVLLNFSIGIRDILLHQFNDYDKDLKSGTNTFFINNVLLSKKLISWFEELTSLLIIILLGLLYFYSNLFYLFLVAILVIFYWLYKLVKKNIEVNYLIRFYILISSVFMLIFSNNKLTSLLLLIHPFNIQISSHYAIKLCPKILFFFNKVKILLSHIYKSKITLLINYILFFSFLLIGRNLKKKPLYKKKPKK